MANKNFKKILKQASLLWLGTFLSTAGVALQTQMSNPTMRFPLLSVVLAPTAISFVFLGKEIGTK